MARSIDVAGLALIKSFEGFRATAYQDEAGVWTIGYGHTAGVTESSPAITEPQGELLLRADLQTAEESVEHFIGVDLNDNQFSALVSLVYNTGAAPLRRTLGQKLNDGDYDGAAHEFQRWRRAGGMVSDGLVRRRKAEADLFMTPVEEPATHNID